MIGRLLERWRRDAIIVFLDTQVEECIRRVRTRRLERGDEREFDSRLLIQKHATVARLRQKIDAVGVVQTRAVSGENAASIVINLLEQQPTPERSVGMVRMFYRMDFEMIEPFRPTIKEKPTV